MFFRFSSPGELRSRDGMKAALSEVEVEGLEKKGHLRTFHIAARIDNGCVKRKEWHLFYFCSQVEAQTEGNTQRVLHAKKGSIF